MQLEARGYRHYGVLERTRAGAIVGCLLDMFGSVTRCLQAQGVCSCAPFIDCSGYGFSVIKPFAAPAAEFAGRLIAFTTCATDNITGL